MTAQSFGMLCTMMGGTVALTVGHADAPGVDFVRKEHQIKSKAISR